MARSTDPKKVALWQGRFRRFEESGLSVARFCAAEGISESSFYYWLKKVGRSQRRGFGPRPSAVATRCGQGLGATRPPDRGREFDAAERGPVERGVFKPVAVVPATCAVVVRLPGGVWIEVDASQLDAIEAVVAATVRSDRGRASGQGVSSDHHVDGRRQSAVSC